MMVYEPFGIVFLKLLVVALLLFTNGFFVSFEYSLVSVRRSRIEQLASQGSIAAALVRRLLDQTDRYLAASQLGITMSSLGIGWIAEETVAHLLSAIVEKWQLVFVSNATIDLVALVVAFMLVTGLHIVLGEQAPKIFAIRRAEVVSMLTSPAILWFERFFRPFTWTLASATRMVLRMVGIKAESAHQHMYSMEELKYFISESQKLGLLHPEQEEMALRALELATKEAKAVMVPRTRIVSIDENSNIEDFLKTFAQHPHARFPVHRQSTDNLVGYVRIKDILMALAHDPGVRQQSLKSFVKATMYVPENKRVGDLFVEMRDNRVQLAVVVEEFGGTSGIITLEEMAEEVVGRVGEALMHESASFRVVDERVIEVSGQMKLNELNKRLRVRLPERAEYETVAGFLLYELRAVPSAGTKYIHDHLEFTVTEMHGARISKVKVTKLT
ncbi:HlyC/CorC family transporter [Candidatus Acetothermia bacterium]|nr:HlyC/CorC family transporter [Candidatus Acetothermia bacterium]